MNEPPVVYAGNASSHLIARRSFLMRLLSSCLILACFSGPLFAQAKPELMIPASINALWFASWSPDGRWMALCHAHGTNLYETTDWRLHRLLHRDTHFPDYTFSASWSPDSKRLASLSDDGTVIIWDIRSGNQLFALETRMRNIPLVADSISWSSDGKHLAASSGQDYRKPELFRHLLAEGNVERALKKAEGKEE